MLPEVERYYNALDKLRDSDDPLVRWIVNNSAIWDEYQEHAEEFLKALPMTLEQIEEFGDDSDWCHVYGDFLEDARSAGVLPKEEVNGINIGNLVSDLNDHFGYDSDDRAAVRRMIRNRLPEILKQAKEIEARNA